MKIKIKIKTFIKKNEHGIISLKIDKMPKNL